MIVVLSVIGIDLYFLQEFFKAHPAPSAERNIQQSLENIRLNVEQLKRDGEHVKKFLSAFN